jgi:hypothetical protein
VTESEVLEDASSLDGYGDHYTDPNTSRDSASANLGISFLDGDPSWHGDVSSIDGAPYYQVRVTFVSSAETAARAGLSALALSWKD